MPKPLLRSGARRLKDPRIAAIGFPECRCHIVYIDSDLTPSAAAADQDGPSGLRVSYGIGQQITEDAIEQHRIAHHMDIRCNGSKIDASLNSGIFVFVSKPGPKRNRANPQRIVAFSQVKGIHQTIELFRQLRRGLLSPVQPCLLRHILARAQQRVAALNNLQRLSEVVSQHAYNRCLKFLRHEGFQPSILHVRRDNKAFDRSYVLPL